jgi:hypothetical protein
MTTQLHCQVQTSPHHHRPPTCYAIPPNPPPQDDLLFLAMLLTGFHGLMRCGELTVPDSISQRNSWKITRRHTVSWPTPTSYGFILPANKTDPFFQGNHLVIQRFVPTLDPRTPFINYLTSRDTAFPLHPERRHWGSPPLVPGLYRDSSLTSKTPTSRANPCVRVVLHASPALVPHLP